MIGLFCAVLFTGYTLVYAAVANRGRFAAEPWRAFTEDAYAVQTPATGGLFGIGKGSILGSVWGWITHPFGLPFNPLSLGL